MALAKPDTFNLLACAACPAPRPMRPCPQLGSGGCACECASAMQMHVPAGRGSRARVPARDRPAAAAHAHAASCACRAGGVLERPRGDFRIAPPHKPHSGPDGSYKPTTLRFWLGPRMIGAAWGGQWHVALGLYSRSAKFTCHIQTGALTPSCHKDHSLKYSL